MKAIFGTVAFRAGVVLTAVSVAAFGAWWLAVYGPKGIPFRCVLNDATGIHCPGCGMTRATHAALEGRFADAFRFNPLGVILLPIALLALVPEVIAWVKGEPPKWRVPVGKRGGIALAVLVIGFMVLRNLPWMPFRLLAPH
ncbi:conserved hypothetical protein [Haloferula helveola]|uniref:DUF2752 domain-containing protein n=1 Tax=Haloferula helveola TaxID=490095 RepID=A0ABN6H8F6_9BACT|nr:conserved hypothetical protein [Haloferula helveola]